MRIVLAGLHLVALGLGLGAVLARGAALRDELDATSLRRAFRADTMWGIAAALWISTGLWRALAETEKSLGYYLSNHVFLGKMAMLGVILLLEMGAMAALIRWRRALARGVPPAEVADPAVARRIATISHVQALLVVMMVFAAVAMARGYGAR